MSYPTISVITVCYNAENTIQETIESVLSQQYDRIEYIVVDGHSTDRTCSIIQSHQKRIAKFISEPDNGIYDAMNKGISLATGDVIGFLNADDVFMHRGVLAKIGRCFSTEQAEACFADLIYFAKTKEKQKVIRYYKASPFYAGAFAKAWCPPHPTFYVKKAVYERFGGFNLSYQLGNDVELMMRFLEKHQVVSHYIPEVFVKMRMGGVSNQSVANIIQQNRCILSAAKALGVPINPFAFAYHKVLSRTRQFLGLRGLPCHYS